MRNFGWILVAATALATASCGGGTSFSTSTSTSSSSSSSSGGTTQSVQLGNGSGSSFQAGVIGVSTASLSAGGSTSLSVSLVQTDGTLYTQPTTITFSSTCIGNGTATISPSATPSTSTGTVTVTYSAKGCIGADVITAAATVNAVSLTASGTVTVAAGAVGSIAFVSASPTNIALKGMGVSGRPESSTVIFQVLDSAGGARQGATVQFSLDTTVGGIALQPSTATATSDAQGNAQIVVSAGTVATSVRVTASTTLANGTVVSTQSSVLTITTGIPTANNFSMAIQCANIEGLNYDGVTTSVTARLSDRFQNPVPDGTAVTFHAKAATIGAQCTTATTATEGGVCAVTFRSSGTRPTGTNGNPQPGPPGNSINGLVPLLATAIGEESFNDANGNGYFDVGETFTDTQEPFENDAWLFSSGRSLYSSSDPSGADWFYDFNNNKLHDAPDGSFNGVLCNDTARCKGPTSAGIGAQGTIILSGSNAVITDLSGNVPGAFTLARSASGTITLWIRDVNNNVMPGSTVISAAASGSAALTVVQTPQNVPCYNPGSAYYPGVQLTGVTVFQFGLSAPATAGSGFLTVSVATQGQASSGVAGTTTSLSIPYTVP